MIDKVRETIEKYKMIQYGDKIVVGLSGGPDSVCLLHVLNRLKDRYGIKLYAVHVNHGIRGEEALRDENYAKRFAESLDIPIFIKRVDAVGFAKENKMSTEEAGRFLRYEYFEEVLKQVKGQKIATAHNMNDQAETMIMNFLRGSGTTGLSGISPVRDFKYIRPILYIERSEIESYCKENGLNPVIDSTNKENVYRRNKIRLELIPYIKDNINPNVVKSLCTSSDLFYKDDEFLNEIAAEKLNEIKKGDGFSVKEFNSLHVSIKRRIIREIILKEKGSLNGIELKHIDDCIELIKKGETGKRIDLPHDLICEIEYEKFKIKNKYLKSLKYEYNLNIPGRINVKEENLIIEAEIKKNDEIFNDSLFIKYFDYDKIKIRAEGFKIQIRTRKDGDFISPKGMKGRKKLKDLFIDEKVPREKRNSIPLVALRNEILWIPNFRDSREYKIDGETKNVLKIKILRGEVNGR
ncbi:MAG TPA: tRNA lysidine(34) synthetase TilS [Clostridiaceae bacterium]|jgi:tRNA(Ile)-lysidine synthase|nr:tRNA lysidine(34) synthetase TilS [Clostridiaceae bacterium]HBG38444.1 tRNA lysidine(34) synthetase TilS [Clostridiaceae bacterium]HBN28863.1 tRNA lysidine(34) synthetase TilS [Clostridiaceae bacterium]HBX47521.1 tRNA lysidine(34) synthetase TilS [Clostridiaceae bacterium]HCL50419.1 tRNA lysidine(34) synthetase TilS [Clostridiaceae bacterium]